MSSQGISILGNVRFVVRLPNPCDTVEEWAAEVKAEMAMQQRPKLDGPNVSHLLEAKDPTDS